jgi:hypothetical protein
LKKVSPHRGIILSVEAEILATSDKTFAWLPPEVEGSIDWLTAIIIKVLIKMLFLKWKVKRKMQLVIASIFKPILKIDIF